PDGVRGTLHARRTTTVPRQRGGARRLAPPGRGLRVWRPRGVRAGGLGHADPDRRGAELRRVGVPHDAALPERPLLAAVSVQPNSSGRLPLTSPSLSPV